MSLTAQITATPKNAAGSAIVGKTVTWATQNAAIATVSSGGLITAVSVGNTTITATVDGISANVTVNVGRAAAPGISLLPQANPVTLQRSSTVTFALQVVRFGGFTGTINLSAASLPSGVTATFSSASLALGAPAPTVTLTATGAATLGTTPISIVGTASGLAAVAAVVQLTVVVSGSQGISLVTNIGSATVARGSQVTVVATLTRLGGYTGDVNVDYAGIPSQFVGGVAQFIYVNPQFVVFPPGATTVSYTLTIGSNYPTGPIEFYARVNASISGVTHDVVSLPVVLTIT